MIRKAIKEDCPELYDLIHEILVDMELPLLTLLEPDVLKAAVVRAMQEDVYRFSYRNGLVYEENGEILGCCFGYPGASEPIIDASRPLSIRCTSRQPGFSLIAKHLPENGIWIPS